MQRPPIVLLPPNVGENWDRSRSDYDIEGATARHRFREFFRNFRLGTVYMYRDALIRHYNRKEYFVEIDLAHVNEYDEVLFNALQTRPEYILPFFEAGAKDALKLLLTESRSSELEAVTSSTPDFQIILKSSQFPHSLRNLTAEHVNKLVKVKGEGSRHF